MPGAGAVPYNAGMAGSVRERLTHLQRRMRAAERRFGRPPGSARLLAVGKAQPPAAVRAAAGLGVADFGENRLQPALAKMAALSDLDLTWHFIGAIQRRKAREIARRFDWVHSLDRLEVAERLDRARPPERAPLPVCVQVNLSGEPGKSGIERGRLLEFLAELRRFPRLRPRGLIERVPHSNRYAVTAAGLRAAMCYHRVFARVMRPAMSVVFNVPPKSECRLARAVDSFDREVDRLWRGMPLAA